MRVLFDITHPAQLHFFKYAMQELHDQGHNVLATARDKDVTLGLSAALGIPCVSISRMGTGLAGMAKELVQRDWRLLLLAGSFRPDVMVARMGISIGFVGAVLGVPRIIFEDTEHARLQAALSLPLATVICTGTGYLKKYGRRQLRYRGIPALAYLAPNRFQPNPRPLRQAGVQPDQPYIVLRLVAWAAAHDAGLSGPSEQEVIETVERLSHFGRVLISSEQPLPSSLRDHRNPVPIEHMHDLLAFASLYMGEGGTMAAEAAVLGTPAIFCNPLRTGYLLALEKRYQLVHNTDTLAQGAQIAERILRRQNLRQEWQRKRRTLLEQSDDIVQFTCRVINEIGTRRRSRRTPSQASSAT